jgi:hypothetical protein
MRVRIDDSNLLETYMNTISSKLTAFAAALVMNSLIMGALGYLFEIQSHPTCRFSLLPGQSRRING